MSEIVKSSVDISSMSCELQPTAATGADYFLADNSDSRLLLFVKNANASQNAAVTVKAGTGRLSTCGDIVLTVAAGKTAAVPMNRLESARVKVLSGADKGKVLVNTSVDSGGSLSSVSLFVLSVL